MHVDERHDPRSATIHAGLISASLILIPNGQCVLDRPDDLVHQFDYRYRPCKFVEMIRGSTST